jgi:hypothetical protein
MDHASHTFSKLHALVSFLTDFIPYLLHPLSLEFENRIAAPGQGWDRGSDVASNVVFDMIP